jgi:hypothetical protein
MDFELPKCYTSTNPRARKPHTCCECRGTISKGEKYHLFSGIWDEAHTYKTCAECEVLRSDACPEGHVFGDLYNDVFESGNPNWVKRFMDTRRKRSAPESPKRWMEQREEEILAEA